MEEVKSWQSRPLDSVYPIVYLDALVVKIRETGHVRNKAIYVVIGVNMQGNKEVLGLWAGQAEGAKFWLQVLTELKNRGVTDMFIACVDGLKGFPESIATVFPEAQVQLCIVHQVRASLNYVSWKQRKAVAADLRPIYRASTVEEAEQRLDEFAAKWDGAYPTISQMWRRNWEHLTPFFALSGRHSQGDLYHQRGRVVEYELAQGDQNQGIVPQPGSRYETAVSGPGAHRQEVDYAGAELEGRLAALLDSARRPRSESGVGVNRHSMKNRKKNISGMGALPPNPRDLALSRQDSWTERRAALAISESRPLSRRSGCVSAGPYPPLRSVQSTRDTRLEKVRPFTQKT